jgi:hypothetical protein
VSEPNDLRKRLFQLERENEDLREEARGFLDDYLAVVRGRCPPDVQHCSCVPHLWEHIERLRSTARAAADELEAHWGAHTDEQGLGPVNLVRRLRGLPDSYTNNPQAAGEALEHARLVAYLKARREQADPSERPVFDRLLTQVGRAKAHRFVLPEPPLTKDPPNG